MASNYDKEVNKAVDILNSGGTIIYPTDTIWGLGCDATNSIAVDKVNAIKKRPPDKSLIILLADDSHLNRYLKEVPEIAWDLLDNFTKPTTIIYPGAKNLAPNVLASNGSVGIRIIREGFCKDVIKKLGRPIVSTSANFNGFPSPSNFKDIDAKVLAATDYVVNLLQNESIKNIESTIIKLELNGEISFVRK